MHSFEDLIQGGTSFSLKALSEATERAVQELSRSGSTPPIVALRSVQWQKVCIATGAFSIFEARLQDALSCENGFSGAKEILKDCGEHDLAKRFGIMKKAVNVLKHGTGDSYNFLVGIVDQLPFKLKLPGESFFDEGDVSEIPTLIEVDDDLVSQCTSLIAEVAAVIKREQPHTIL